MQQKTNGLPAYVKLNHAIRPQDDFYAYVCHHWQQDNPLPATRSRWSTFNVLNEKVEGQLENIIQGWLKSKPADLNKEQRQAIICYRSQMESARHSSRSLASLVKLLAELRQISYDDDRKSGLISRAAGRGFHAFFDLDIDIDGKNNSRFLPSFDPVELDMPDREYYLDQDAKFKAFRQAYLEFIAKFNQALTAAGCKAAWQPNKILDIETTLAQLSWPVHKLRNAHKTYNLYQWEDFTRRFRFNWLTYFKEHQIDTPDHLLVSQPSYLRGALFYLKRLPEDDVQMYLNYKASVRLAPLINNKLLKIYFDFFSRTLLGVKKMKPPSKRATEATNDWFVDTLGRAYVAKHFPDSSRQGTIDLAAQVSDSFSQRLANNTWMTEASRKYARQKLSKIIVNLGYNDNWSSYDVQLLDDNPLENQLKLTASLRDKSLALLKQQPNRLCFRLFENHVQRVNAWTYLNLLNTNYPAAFLQPPFYDPAASDEYNLGTLGSVIGHELTHNFDDNGSQYDLDGHLNPWLGKEEQKAFKKAAVKLIRHANKHRPAPNVHMQGKQVIGELIADLGGIAIIVDIVKKKYSNRQQRHQALRRLFIAYAFYHALNESLQSKILGAKAGVHPDHPFRVNGVLAHCDAFYETFDVQKGDTLYLKPSARVMIW